MKIAQKSIQFLTIVVIALFSISAYAVAADKNQDSQHDGGQVNTKKEVEQEYKRAEQSLKDTAATLSVKISERILQKEITSTDNAKIIEELTSKN